jgi:hypothetical protein
MYTRTPENIAEEKPATGKAKTNYTFTPRNQEGILRRPGWPLNASKPDVRNASPKEEAPARVGQSLPSERATRESVPYGSLEEWTTSTLPSHMVTGFDSLTESATTRAVTPLEKFAEERLTKQIGENYKEDEEGRLQVSGTVAGNEEATAELLRKREAFRQLSPKEQRASITGRKAEFDSSKPKELE